ncbi:MAG: UDP-N-acetylmuramoyl-tripeptide--D-alanyl-D-alanine ligase [Actinobacteria bacterium]|nr:UDP-N-acetylmuramoyl-tripeptide--D-alanyl-D-alanine ligase [Actinomycetota bacterium]MBU1866503.1 UDP-N-acetylmuramoyl-tripeptide--D-alanyl-D-alanine ligase [Actinomycetota bacterium]
MKWDLDIVASAAGGKAGGSAMVTSVVTDSRLAGKGVLFVALEGERRDGHDFVDEAIAAGAAVMVRAGALPDGAAGVEVADTLASLRRLAERRRRELAMPVVGITGSNGKTTTKDMLAAALGPGAHKSPQSFNNEIGVPLTILGTPDGATAVVAEVGSRGIGHISLLAAAVQPDVAVITNVERAHLEMFGDAATILDAKWELVEALPPGGTAILPIRDQRLTSRRVGPMLTFGEDPSADVSAVAVALGEDGRAACTLSFRGRSVAVRMAMAGRHQPGNLAAAVAAAVALGTDFEEAAGRAAAAAGSAWRMEIHPGRFTVVNDAYNANPDSTAAALATVAAMPGRHVAVLGKMHELGEGEAAGHREVGARARALGFAAVVVVGDAPGIAEGAGPIARVVADIDQAESVLRGYLAAGDVVLVKASRAVGLEVLAARLRGAAS